MKEKENPNENNLKETIDKEQKDNFNNLIKNIKEFNFEKANELMRKIHTSEGSIASIKKIFTNETYLKDLSLKREPSSRKYTFEEIDFAIFVKLLTQKLAENDINQIIGRIEKIIEEIIKLEPIDRNLDVVKYLINAFVKKNILEKKLTEEIEKVVKSQVKKKDLDELKSLIDILIKNNILNKEEGEKVVEDIKMYFNIATNLELMQHFLMTLTKILTKKCEKKVNDEEEWNEIKKEKEKIFKKADHRIIAEHLKKVKGKFEEWLPKS